MKKFYILLSIFISISISLSSQNLHSKFNITKQKLADTFIQEDLQYAEMIFESNPSFLDLIDKIILEDNNLKLVDKTHKLASDYIPSDIINLTDYNLHTRYKTMPFSEKTLEHFILMSEDAKVDGIDLFIASTYRSYQFQEEIFTNMKNYHGEEKAATIVAYPGSSQHQLGTAVDFGTITPSYAFTDPGKWLLENSWKYGFTISYPKDMEHITTYMWEPWHYRYIGISAAIVQREYFNDIQHLFLVFWDRYKLFFIENHIL